MTFSKLLSCTAAAVLAASLPAMACPDWQNQPNFGGVELSAGFTPDPHVLEMVAGGDIDLSSCDSDAAGFVTAAPDFNLQWGGESAQLTIAVEAEADTVLLINDAEGNWYFNDDHDGLNPGIVIEEPAEGLYSIWVGTFTAGQGAPARLIITELDH